MNASSGLGSLLRYAAAALPPFGSRWPGEIAAITKG
jgi:hypothetical protein